MTQTQRNLGLFAGVALLFILTGVFQSWNLSLQILNIGILSAIMALGVNMQWGYAGLFSTGIVGSVALGGLAVVLVSSRPVPEAFAAGGWQLFSRAGGWQAVRDQPVVPEETRAAMEARVDWKRLPEAPLPPADATPATNDQTP